MELDQLKEIWKEVGEKETEPAGRQELCDLLGRPSKGPVARIKHNLFLELVTVLVLFGAGAIYYFIAFKGRFNEIAWGYVILSILFCVYYYRKNKLLNEMQCTTCRVKSNLEKQVNTLEKYVRFYLLAGSGLMPVVLVFLALLLHYKVPGVNFLNPFFPSAENPWWKAGLNSVLFLAFTTGIIYILNAWYIRKIYGRHIDKLKQIIAEMNEEN